LDKEKKKLTETEWVQRIEEMKKLGEDWSTRKQIMINVSYYLGNQWIGWDKASKTVRTLPTQDGQERITHNVLQQRVQTKLSKQTKNRIKYDVTPDTGDQDRVETAKAATKFIRTWWDSEEMDLKTRDIFINGNVKGYVAGKLFFDPEAGKDITPGENDPGYDMWKEAGEKKIHTGEIRFRVCDPLTLYIDPSATTEDEIRWIVEEKPRDVDYIKEKYDKEVIPDDNVTFDSSYDATGGIGIGETGKKSKNMVMVRELWMKPCKQYPNGLKVTTTRQDFLDADENAGELPYIIFGDIPVPGSVKYKSFLESMLPIQRNLNIALTMFATNMKKMGATKWLVPLGSNVDEEELNDEISSIIHYNGAAGKVERSAGADIPNGFDRIIEYYNRLIDDMSGAREITTGRLPAGLDTASGLALMVEQENEKLAVSSQNYERGIKKTLKRVLRLMKKHYTEERLGRILGDDGEVELVSFLGSDLSGEEDINIIQGSSLPEMKSAQQDRIMTLWSANAIVKKDGTPDQGTFLKMMGLGDSSELFEQNQLDENNAKMENKQFEQMVSNPQMTQAAMQYMAANTAYMQMQATGLDPAQLGITPPPPIPGMPRLWDSDDHEIHIYQHGLFRKGSVYRNEMDDAQRAFVDLHYQQHIDALQAPIIAQQQAEMEAMQQQKQQESESADKDRQFQRESKQQEHSMKMEQEAMKGNMAMQMAGMKAGQR
jgi:hypothetical protein